MIEKLTGQITAAICTEGYNKPIDRAKIQYGLNIILGEGFKVIALVIVFLLMGRINYFALSLGVLIPIRVFSGGLHVKGNIRCLCVSALIFVCTCIIAPMIPDGNEMHFIAAAILSLIPVVWKAPISSVTRPIKTRSKRLEHKIAAISFSILWMLVLAMVFNNSYIRCGLTTIVIQNLQLLFVKEELK